MPWSKMSGRLTGNKVAGLPSILLASLALHEAIFGYVIWCTDDENLLKADERSHNRF